MSKLTLLIGFLSSVLASNIQANTAEAYLVVSCKVVRPGQVSINVPKQSFHTFSYTSDEKTMISDIEINCPQGTAVNVSFETDFGDSKKNNMDSPPHYAQFYKDANCTELWQPYETAGYCSTHSGQTISNKIFCKTNNKALNPGIDKKIVLMNLVINY
jgi:hypothetical protein